MKVLALGAATALASLAAGCCTLGSGGGAAGGGGCPASSSATTGAPVSLADTIVNEAPFGQPLNFKPHHVADSHSQPAACVDGTTGDINLYRSSLTLNLTFDPSLAGTATWPADATVALETADAPSGPWHAPSWIPAPTVSGGALAFTIPYQAGKTYYYRLQYVHPGSPVGPLYVVEPMIRNH